MLPFNLLRVQTRKGIIKPVYADINSMNLGLATEMIELFRIHVGKKRSQLLEKVSTLETGRFDYRFPRGLSTILLRLCVFQVEAKVNPLVARELIYQKAGKSKELTTGETRRQVLASVARHLNVTIQQLEESFYADLEDELVLKEFTGVTPVELLKRYNMALTQALLFKSTFIEVKVSSRWKEVLRDVKFQGLMYTAETRNGTFQISIDGPVSLLKLTQRYGNNMAKVLPSIIQAGHWEVKANVVKTSQYGKRILRLSLTSSQVGDKIKPATMPRKSDEVSFDSRVEEKFYRNFKSLGSEWKIVREPSPLIVGRHVFIPDFCFEKGGKKVYMEIVGFWTKKYLESKIRKLSELQNIDIIVAANERLACEKLRTVKGFVVFYKKTVPLKPILKLLKDREETLIQREIQSLNLKQLRLSGDVIELHALAREYGVSDKALKQKLRGFKVEGYTLTGELFVSDKKLGEVNLKIASLENPSLSHIIQLIEDAGIDKPHEVLSALQYRIRWNGLDLDKSTVFKKKNRGKEAGNPLDLNQESRT